MFIQRIYNYQIDTGEVHSLNYNRAKGIADYTPIESLDIKLRSVYKRKNKKKVADFTVKLVKNELGTDILMLIPQDKIRVTAYKDKKTKKMKFSAEKYDLFINKDKIVLNILGTYRGIYYVCEFQKKNIE